MAGNDQHINISLYYQRNDGQLIDLRIPKRISTYQLIKEINKIFGAPDFNYKYQIKIKNKGILLDGNQMIQEYPVTNGDIIEVLEEKIND